MYQITFYIPESHLKSVKNSMFDAGAARVGNYEKCAWQVLGQGQFFANENSNPVLGEKGEVTVVPEYKVEMVCKKEIIETVIAAMKEAHPYETPAYSVTAMIQM